MHITHHIFYNTILFYCNENIIILETLIFPELIFERVLVKKVCSYNVIAYRNNLLKLSLHTTTRRPLKVTLSLL